MQKKETGPLSLTIYKTARNGLKTSVKTETMNLLEEI